MSIEEQRKELENTKVTINLLDFSKAFEKVSEDIGSVSILAHLCSNIINDLINMNDIDTHNVSTMKSSLEQITVEINALQFMRLFIKNSIFPILIGAAICKKISDIIFVKKETVNIKEVN